MLYLVSPVLTEVENTYNFPPEKRSKIYKPSNCIYRDLLKTIKTYCNCYPSYIGKNSLTDHCYLPPFSICWIKRFVKTLKDNVKDHVNTTNLQECNFYLHGVCISFLFNRFSEGFILAVWANFNWMIIKPKLEPIIQTASRLAIPIISMLKHCMYSTQYICCIS